NSKIFAKAGLRPPTNWPEFVEVAEKLKHQGVTPFALGARERWPAQFWFDYLLLRTAGPEYRERLMQGTAAYTDPQVKEAFALWADLLKKDYFNKSANDLDWAEAAKLVCTGEAAATLMGTWAIQLLTGEGCGLKEEEGFDFFAFPVIDPAIAKVAVGPVDGIVVAKDSIHHELAKKLLPFFAESESQKTMSAGSGGFSPSLQVGKEYYSPLRRRILGEVESSQHWAFAYDLATPIAIAEKGMDSFNELIEFPEQFEAILDFLQQEINSLSDKQTKKQ
ncbi:MAG: extracellular solute-binding protein, partial [Desulfobulbaceae bacterium]